MGLLSDDISICTLVGAGSSFTGDLRVNGAMMLEGDIDGDIEVSGNLIIGEKARVRGNVSAKSAVISGIVLGDVTAPESVRLLATSIVLGDISTHRLQAAQGVVVNGHCISLSDEDLYEKESTRQRQLNEIKKKTIIK